MVVSELSIFSWHDVPPPEIATGSLLGIDYEVWSHPHLISSIIFTGATIFHLQLKAIIDKSSVVAVGQRA
ncbi:MAG: hypothetical protein ACK5PU_02400 [bacterium]|jgi:hypothetical protein